MRDDEKPPELLGEVVLDALLEIGVAVESELGREPDHGGSPDIGCPRQVGDGTESDGLRSGQDRLGHPAFGGGQGGTMSTDPFRDFHDPQP